MSDFWTNNKWHFDQHAGYVTKTKHQAFVDVELEVLTFNMHISRRSSYFSQTLVYPCLVILTLTLLIFWLPHNSGQRIVLGCFAILICTCLSINLARQLPPSRHRVPSIG